jgi:hypothetical protein
MTFIIALFVMTLTFLLAKQDKDRVTVRYDCRVLIGGWHPDVPIVVMEECKKRIKQ